MDAAILSVARDERSVSETPRFGRLTAEPAESAENRTCWQRSRYVTCPKSPFRPIRREPRQSRFRKSPSGVLMQAPFGQGAMECGGLDAALAIAPVVPRRSILPASTAYQRGSTDDEAGTRGEGRGSRDERPGTSDQGRGTRDERLRATERRSRLTAGTSAAVHRPDAPGARTASVAPPGLDVSADRSPGLPPPGWNGSPCGLGRRRA